MKISLRECLQSGMILDWRSGTDIEAIPLLAAKFERPDDGEEWTWITLGDVQVTVQCGEAGNKVFFSTINPGSSGAKTIRGCRGFSIAANGLRPRMMKGDFTRWCEENGVIYAVRDDLPGSNGNVLRIGAAGLADAYFGMKDRKSELEQIHLASR